MSPLYKLCIFQMSSYLLYFKEHKVKIELNDLTVQSVKLVISAKFKELENERFKIMQYDDIQFNEFVDVDSEVDSEGSKKLKVEVLQSKYISLVFIVGAGYFWSNIFCVA